MKSTNRSFKEHKSHLLMQFQEREIKDKSGHVKISYDHAIWFLNATLNCVFSGFFFSFFKKPINQSSLEQVIYTETSLLAMNNS
jgi:hypothetical protein